MPPEISIRSTLTEMNDAIIKSVCKEQNLSNITYLNLFNNSIKRIAGLTMTPNLKILILSFN